MALAAVPPSLLIHGSGRREDVPIRSSGCADVDGQKEVRAAAAARGATYRVTHLVKGPTLFADLSCAIPFVEVLVLTTRCSP